MTSIRQAKAAQTTPNTEVPNPAPHEDSPLTASQSRAKVRAAWDRVLKSHKEKLGANAPVYTPSVETLDTACQDLSTILDSEMEIWTSKEVQDEFTWRVVRVTSRLWKEIAVWLQAGGHTDSCGLGLMLQAVIWLLKDVPSWGERVPLFRAFNVFFAEEWVSRRDFGEIANMGEEMMGEETVFARAALLRDSVRTILEMKKVEEDGVVKEAEGMEYIVPECLAPEGKDTSKGEGKKAKVVAVEKPKAGRKTKVKTRGTYYSRIIGVLSYDITHWTGIEYLFLLFNIEVEKGWSQCLSRRELY